MKQLKQLKQRKQPTQKPIQKPIHSLGSEAFIWPWPAFGVIPLAWKPSMLKF
ncbi:hypothetical protein ACFSL6_18425 [Paenibacillus thailandensis]|uniref:Uncharacterized protein n=1 Tax=Paenibacillus thailandensis TaxID=393250 RepID=A0ABW5QRV3_9BACL